MFSLREFLIRCKISYYRFKGVNISSGSKISLKANIDTTNPKGIHIADGAYIAFGATVLSHDFTRSLHANTYIERNVFIGANSIILPGITVGQGSIVAAGSVVTKDIPVNVIVAGNPAAIIKENITTGRWGQLTK